MNYVFSNVMNVTFVHYISLLFQFTNKILVGILLLINVYNTTLYIQTKILYPLRNPLPMPWFNNA